MEEFGKDGSGVYFMKVKKMSNRQKSLKGNWYIKNLFNVNTLSRSSSNLAVLQLFFQISTLILSIAAFCLLHLETL